MFRYLVIMACGLAIGSIILTMQTQTQMNQKIQQLQNVIQQNELTYQAMQAQHSHNELAINLSRTNLDSTPIDNYWAQGVKKATHSVVSIYSEPSQISGSGIILDNEGLIVSNAHVVDAAFANHETFNVILSDGREYPAQVIAISQRLDVALLLINAPSLQAIQLADKAPLLGQPVFSIGSPLDIGQTASMGIVSGFKHFAFAHKKSNEYIQTDALIHPGSSGGALVNQLGELIGMNVLFLKNEKNAEQHLGISFVLPIQSVFEEISALLTHTNLSDTHYLGLSVMRVMEHAVVDQQFIITHVTQGSPADKLGLKIGDIFDQSFKDEAALRAALATGKVDNIIRNEKVMDM